MCERDAIRLGRIDTVNTGHDRGFAGGGANEKNCALCAAAGVVNLAAGSSNWSTEMVASALGNSDNILGAGSSVDAQAANIKTFGQGLTGRTATQLGTMADEQPYATATTFMDGFPDKTVYAVCCSGPLHSGGETKCHWLNAAKLGGKIRYFDFQPMKSSRAGLPGKSNAASCDVPFIGVITQMRSGATNKDMHGLQQLGRMSTTNTKMVVLAFPPR